MDEYSTKKWRDKKISYTMAAFAMIKRFVSCYGQRISMGVKKFINGTHRWCRRWKIGFDLSICFSIALLTTS